MIGRSAAALLLLVAGLVLLGAVPAFACSEDADLVTASQTCDKSASEIEEVKADYPMAVWSVVQICKDGGRRPDGVCFNPDDCSTAAGVPGTRYTLYRDGENVGTACLTAGEQQAVDDPPPVRALVLRAFKTLEWPASELVVQPPDGKTLVNLETNFYTENTGPTNIPVRLVRSDVVVTASPIAYRWHFGDGTSVTTESPGAPYPDLDVAHVYSRTDEVLVSVDTQYGDASFTVDGGPPEDIPSTIWITGADEDLRIVEAIPQLVIR